MPLGLSEAWWHAIEALATCCLVIATIGVSALLAVYERRFTLAREAAAAKDRVSTISREVFGQWQTYNLAVANGWLTLKALPDDDFKGLDEFQVKRLHVVFF